MPSQERCEERHDYIDAPSCDCHLQPDEPPAHQGRCETCGKDKISEIKYGVQMAGALAGFYCGCKPIPVVSNEFAGQERKEWWEEEFQKEFIIKGGCRWCDEVRTDPEVGKVCVHEYYPEKLKNFIRRVELKAREEEREKALNEAIEALDLIRRRKGYSEARDADIQAIQDLISKNQ